MNNFGKLVTIFSWTLVSRTSKQVWRIWGHYGNWGSRMILTYPPCYWNKTLVAKLHSKTAAACNCNLKMIIEGFRGQPGGKSSPCLIRESETTIKIKFAFFWGGGGRQGAERKIVQNAIFRGKRHDNKILKVKILLSRNFVVMAQAPFLRLATL